MNRVLLIGEAYLRLLNHDRFLRRHDLATLIEELRKGGESVANERNSASAKIVHALNVASVFYPRQVLCLQRSAVLVGMLRRHGVEARMVIGVQRLPFKAHAWVEVNGAVFDDGLASREHFLIVEVC